MSRFNRTVQAGNSITTGQDTESAPTASPSQASANQGNTAMETDLQELNRRLEKLRDRRTRREIELENAEKEIQDCQAQAAKLGVNSFEELEELVRKHQEEDARAIAEFVEALDKEEELLDTIDRRLSEAQGS